MKLRNQMLTLSLATLLVPWFGWKLVQELERFLRAGQETALLASAHTVARAMPVEFQSELMFGRQGLLQLRELDAAAQLDGYADDWPAADQFHVFESADGLLKLEVMAGRAGNQLFLFCRVTDSSPVREAIPATGTGAPLSDGLNLALRSSRGLNSFNVHTAAPGRLLLNSQTEGGGQLEGYWLDQPTGYQVELALPLITELVDISIGAQDVESKFNSLRIVREAGTMQNGRPVSWLSMKGINQSLNTWLASVVPAGTRAWILDGGAWVMADSGPAPALQTRALSFVERLLYRLVAGRRTELLPARPEQSVRLKEALTDTALAGNDARHWGQDPDNALVRNTVAVPVLIAGDILGSVVLEANSDGLLLVTNRVLGRLLLSTLLLTVGLIAGLWFFSTRLSRRVQRLSSAVSDAMDESGNPRNLPLTEDGDELGELARNNAHLLRAVAGYTRYLQKLAGRLSHELKTPLAITRSSLDNLVSQDLNEESRRYVQRAREGLERQTAIVQAMSEANRLEAAVKSADWEQVDLVQVVAACVDAYQGLHPERKIMFETSAPSLPCRCAPDLLAQALDKLVENAISLTGDDEVIRIRLKSTDPGLALGVHNTGTRLPDVNPEQLFDSLVSHREAGEGRHLGLGLYIVRLVAKAHGGSARARNVETPAGVEFEITLPGD